MARKRLGEILVDAGVLDDTGLRAALVEQRRWGGQLGRILVDMHLVTEKVLVQALSHQLNFPTVKLDDIDIEPRVLELVSADLAEQHAMIPFNREGKFLDVAMSDPTNLGIIDELRIRTQLNVRSYLCGPKEIERGLARFYRRGLANFGGFDPRDRKKPGEGDFPESVELDLDTSLRPAASASASARRAQAFELASSETGSASIRDAEIVALQERISKLEALLTRDEDVLRKVLALLVEKGIASREEILERIK